MGKNQKYQYLLSNVEAIRRINTTKTETLDSSIKFDKLVTEVMKTLDRLDVRVKKLEAIAPVLVKFLSEVRAETGDKRVVMEGLEHLGFMAATVDLFQPRFMLYAVNFIEHNLGVSQQDVDSMLRVFDEKVMEPFVPRLQGLTDLFRPAVTTPPMLHMSEAFTQFNGKLTSGNSFVRELMKKLRGRLSEQEYVENYRLETPQTNNTDVRTGRQEL